MELGCRFVSLLDSQAWKSQREKQHEVLSGVCCPPCCLLAGMGKREQADGLESCLAFCCASKTWVTTLDLQGPGLALSQLWLPGPEPG